MGKPSTVFRPPLLTALGFVAACATSPSATSDLTLVYSGDGPYAEQAVLSVGLEGGDGDHRMIDGTALQPSPDLDLPHLGPLPMSTTGTVSLSVVIATPPSDTLVRWIRLINLESNHEYQAWITATTHRLIRSVCSNPELIPFSRGGVGSPIDTLAVLFVARPKPIQRARSQILEPPLC